jgi:hypothetical protein
LKNSPKEFKHTFEKEEEKNSVNLKIRSGEKLNLRDRRIKDFAKVKNA